MVRPRHARGLLTHSLCVLCRWAVSGALLLLAAVSHAGAGPLRIVPGLEEPLVATGPTSRSEDAALEAALARFAQPPSAPSDFADAARPLTAFLADHPRSAWRMALLTDLGIGYYHAGYFSKAMTAWAQAWQLGRGATQPPAKALADRAAGELARMHARLGHAAELDALFSDMGDRAVGGPATEMIAGAREGLWSFRNDYGTAYLCGPMALRNLLTSMNAQPAKIALMNAQRSGPQGFDLDQLSQLAAKVGLAHRVVLRTPRQAIPVPSVVHWKLHHYAAIVEEKNGRYHVQDPTFASGDAWLTRAAIDEESSGYFLVPHAASADAGWRSASVDEARRVHGMGQTANNEPGNTMPASKGLYPVSCDRMCEVNAKTMLVSLNLNDTPVGYTPPKGPPVQVRLSYNQREAGQPAVFGFFNVSPKWSLNVLSWIEDDPAQPGIGVVRHVAGGGSLGPLDYLPGAYTRATGTFGPERESRSILARIPGTGAASSYELRMPDGSKQVFAHADGATTRPRRMFLTQIVDPAGNASTFNYDAQLRLISITDAVGRNTVFAYEAPSSPLLVTRITDPFGRHADLGYDGQGRLASITDVIGITSSFTYDAGGLVNAMTTPYGTSHFRYGQDMTVNSRYLEMTDPLGFTERVEFRHSAPGIGGSESPVPVMHGSLQNIYLQYRNSFHWDPHAHAVAAGNYAAARLTHWLHDPSGLTSPIAESTKAPLEGRVWNLYPGQSASYYEGSSGMPNQVARVLDGGATQLTSFDRNAFGKPVSVTDPAGRTSLFSYADGGIDLLAVQQRTAGAGSATLATFTYNGQHLPLSRTDAAGQVTHYAYNAAGQPVSVTDPLGNTTRYVYDEAGRLLTVLDAKGAARLNLSYDAFDRVASSTGSEGYTQTYQYDALDRLTQIGYPDGTTTQHTYDKLDRVASKDRLGRITRYAYDANRQLISITDPLGQTTAFGYHENGTLRSITDAKGNVTSWDIDVQGRPVAKHHADGSTETYGYEPLSGRLKSVTDAQGQTRAMTYTVDDRPASLGYLGARTSTPGVTYAYDAVYPRLVSMTDANGVTAYAYNLAGSPGANQLAMITSPVAGQPGLTDTVAYAYDALGRVTERNVDGATDKRSFDAIDRLASVESALGRFDYRYVDASDRVSAIVGADGLQTAMRYYGPQGDEMLKQIAYTSATGAPLASYAYTYDANHNVLSFADALPGETLSALSPMGAGDPGDSGVPLAAVRWLASIAAPGAFAALLIALALAIATWRTTNRRSVHIGVPLVALALMVSCGGGGNGGSTGGVNWGSGASGSDGTSNSSGTNNGAATANSADAEAGPGTTSGAGANGGTSGITPAPNPNARLTRYRYDDTDRLIAASSALNVPGAPILASYAYGYDKASNLVSMNGNGIVRDLDVTATNALSAGTYDAGGNPLKLGAATYGWDAANRLVSHTVNNTDSSFVYDGQSRLVRIIDRQEGVVVADRSYLWCGLERCLERDNMKAGAPVSKRYFAQGVVQDGVPFRYISDSPGSVRQLVDANGRVRARYNYGPYGDRNKMSGDVDADFAFAGLFEHTLSGLDLAVYRSYDAQRGRWLNRDPIGEAGGLNLYAYLHGNPIDDIDPEGLAGCIVSFPDYPIDTGFGFSSTNLGGHDGILSYDSQGATRYYEYGRYAPTDPLVIGDKRPKDDGNVRRVLVPDLQIDPRTGQPTPKSMDALRKALSERAGDHTKTGLTCEADADEKKINKYAEDYAKSVSRPKYSWTPWSSNQCRDFAGRALGVGK
ncbi:Cell wall-associated polypeptide CWBP200 [Variovorax sp. SRS16]|nr:Cell wall-associated polypeptide CWBP200 [Variovorax sp. SRS16]